MKTIKILIITVLLTLTESGCVTNNGDIGDYYGTWALDEITVDGTRNDSWNADGTWTNWSFQNNIICIARFNDLGDKTEAWGTWSEQDGKLLLDYTHRENGTEYQPYPYVAPRWIFFRPDAVNVMKIDSRNGRKMVLSATGEDGATITYSLRKTY